MASTAVSTLPKAVIMITGTWAFCRRIRARNSRPSMSGSLRSVSTRSARSTILRPSSAVAALSTSKPAEASCSSMTRRSFSSSSTTRMRFFMRRAVAAQSEGSPLHRQQHVEHAAFARFALHCYFTAVFIHDFRNDGQAQSDALRLGGEERIEDVVAVLGLDSRAAVDHRDFGGAPAPRGFSRSPRRPPGVPARRSSTRL